MPKAAALWERFQQQEGSAPRAVRRSTDRQDFRRAYYALVDRALEEDLKGHYIMNYHGIGGVSKSALLRRLEAELLREEELPEDEARRPCKEARAKLQKRCQRQFRGKRPVVLRADFDDTALKTPEDVLLRFRAQLMRQYDKAMFPLFDIAMLRLSQKYGKRLPSAEQKEMLSDDPMISFVLDVVGDFTGTGVPQMAAKVGQSVARLAGWKNVIQKTNAEISRMDAPELERRLAYYFAMDVNAMDLPLVCVYLDTYEEMTAQAEGAGQSTGFDEEWLRGDLGLVHNLGNAVFAIAGREHLSWPDLPVEKQCVKALSKKDSESFLDSCGIGDKELCSQLYSLTGGEPTYLDLCVDEYEHLTASGKEPITIEDFGGSLDRLIERHTRYIPQDLRDALYLLAAMGRWSDAVYEELSPLLPVPSPAGTGYYQLTHLSYVQEEEEGVWIMHRPVAQVLAADLDPALGSRLIVALAELAKREPFALDILDGMAQTAPNPRTAQAMARQAQADRGAGRYPEALAWQRRSVELWKALGGAYAPQYGESLAAQADIQWEWLNDRPTPSGQDGETVKDVPQGSRSWKELEEFCQEAIESCEGLGSGLEEALVRLWERRANAEDKLEDWDAAIISWERTLELYARLGRPVAEQLNARLQIGWDHKLAGRGEAARAVLQNTLKVLVALDQAAGRAHSPKTLLAAELLCQCYDDLHLETPGRWEDRLAQLQTWLRSQDYTITGEEPLEELLDWQDWIGVSHASFWSHCGMGKEGADASERLQRAAGLARQVISGLTKYLGEQHTKVLNARMELVRIYMDEEGAKGAGAVMNADYAVRLMEEDRAPLGSVPEKVICLFTDPEAVLTICQELVELMTLAVGRECPNAYEAKDLLAQVYEQAGRPKEASYLRAGLYADYSKIDDPASRREFQRQELLLIEDYRRAGFWPSAIHFQTRRLEHLSEFPDLSPDLERDRLCTLYLSYLWQSENMPQSQVEGLLHKLLARAEEFEPINRRRYLDSAWQLCQAHAGEGLEDVKVDVALALADALSFENDVIELLEPWAEERSLSVPQRCAVLLRLGRAYRKTRGGRERSVELLEELTLLAGVQEELAEVIKARPEVECPDPGTALLELGLSRRKLAGSLVGDRFQRTAGEMLDAFRGALAWREEHLSPEDPAVDAARFELAGALVWVGEREEAVPLLETVVAFRRRTLGEMARETVEAELELAAALARTEGRYEEALALFQNAKGRIEELHLPLFTFKTQYALYRGTGGTLSFMEWQEAGEPEHD